MSDKLIIPGETDPAALAARTIKDAQDGARGTRRSRALLQARKFLPPAGRRRLRGIVGYRGRPRHLLTSDELQQLEAALQESINRDYDEFAKLPKPTV